MSTKLRSEYFGPYKIIRSLGSAHNAARFVVLCSRTDTNYQLYRFEQINNHKQRRLFFNALLNMSKLEHAHILKIRSVSYDDHGRLCVITPYTGNHEGLVTLEELLAIRDGRFGVVESARAIAHLLDAAKHAHAHQVLNGTISESDILVDRFGCLQIQLYGFKACTGLSDDSPVARSMIIADEVRSIVALGYTMMTGLAAKDEFIVPSRVCKKIDRLWDKWFEVGLDPIDGFDSLDHAIRALPMNSDCERWLDTKNQRISQVHIGTMLRRFRQASPTRSARK